jgi:flagella basal body P-ring formation protein FlgA
MFRLLLTILCATALLAVAPVVRAGASAASPDLRLFVENQAAGGAAPGTRIEVTIGELSPRLQLALCKRIEPFVPANVRLWGRSQIGLRCVDGATWSVRLPVTVRIFGPALVATRPLAAHAALVDGDLAEAEVEWTREAQGVATDPSQVEGRVLTRALAAGQPVPLAALRAPQVIAAGDSVKLLGQGRGFAISAQAIALGPAQDGQAVRVRTESGRVITGTARAGRRVEVTF